MTIVNPVVFSPPRFATPKLADYLPDPSRPSASLDLYLPTSEAGAPWPTVIVIHGGGWRSGDKAEPRHVETAAILCNAGFAALSINYRLNEPALGGMTSADAVAWPENLADCLVALDWVCSGGGQQWKLDSQRVAMIGFSAGGHLAMHAAARRSDRVRCLVNFYGPGRLTGRLAETFLNFQPDVTGETLAAAQVHPLLGTGFPPVLLTHGTDDSLVPVEDSRWLADEIRRAGARCVYREIPGAPHGFTMSWGDGSLANAILAFLKQFTND